MIPFDSSDPLTVVLSWICVSLLRWGLRRWSPRTYRRVRHSLPAIALLFAVALRVGFEAAGGEPLTAATFARAFAAAASAVFAHSQFREVMKAVGGEPPDVSGGRGERAQDSSAASTWPASNERQAGPSGPKETR